MKKIRVVLDWFANTNHTGILLAQKRGYFAQSGLDVNIHGAVHGTMNLDETDIVLGPQISMLEQLEKGNNLVAVATLTQRCDSGLVSLKEEGITSLRYLEGKRLTHWAPPWFHAVVGHAVALDGGDYSKIRLVPMDVGDIVSTLGALADAIWVYENWECQELLDAGKEINFIRLADVSPLFDFCAPCIAATQDFAENHPGELRIFLSELARAYTEAANRPEVVLEVKDDMPPVSDAMLLRSQKHLATILLDENGNWGHIGPERWNRMADWMVENGFYDRRRPNEFSNEFLPADKI